MGSRDAPRGSGTEPSKGLRGDVLAYAVTGVTCSSLVSVVVSQAYRADAWPGSPALVALVAALSAALVSACGGACASLLCRAKPVRRSPGSAVLFPVPMALGFAAAGFSHWHGIFHQDLSRASVWVYAAGLAVGSGLLGLLALAARRFLRPAVAIASLALAAAVVATAGMSLPAEDAVGVARADAARSVPPAGPAPHTIVLLTFDTLRYDHLSSSGYRRSTSPELDGHLANSLRFDAALAPKGHTGPSLASLLTGVYPPRHGALRHGWRISRGTPTLAQLLPDRYVSAAFVANPIAVPLARGFDMVPRLADRHADAVVEQAERWLRSQGDRAVLLWVHLFEPHYPYHSLPDDLRRFESDAFRVVSEFVPYSPEAAEARLRRTDDPHLPIDARVDRLAARYDASIRYATRAGARLLDAVRVLREDAFVLITADHGESLVEHGYFFDHGQFVYQPVAHVPFAISYAPLGLNGASSAPVSLVDVVPTVCGLAGCDDRGETDGFDLLAPDLPGEDRPVFTSGKENPPYMSWAIVESGWKYLVTPRRAFAPVDALVANRFALFGPLLGAAQPTHPYRFRALEEELYDLSRDPGELRNRAGDAVARREAMDRALFLWLDEQFSDPAATGAVGRKRIDDETLEELRALGYVQ